MFQCARTLIAGAGWKGASDGGSFIDHNVWAAGFISNASNLDDGERSSLSHTSEAYRRSHLQLRVRETDAGIDVEVDVEPASTKASLERRIRRECFK